MNSESRRAFLTRTSVAAPALATLGVVAPTAMAGGIGGRRQVVQGSPYPTFSRAVVFDRTVFVSGVVGQRSGTHDLVSPEFEPQCRQALENLKTSVEAAGSSMANVLKCTCFLTDASDFAAFNKIYVTYFPSEPPARSTVIVKALVVPGAKLEIDCVSALD